MVLIMQSDDAPINLQYTDIAEGDIEPKDDAATITPADNLEDENCVEGLPEHYIKTLSHEKTFVDGGEEVDGGYGWLVVLGSFAAMFTSFGVMSSWGIMQDYYLRTLFDNDPSAVVPLSFVGTLADCFLGIFSPVIQICAGKYGLRSVIIGGTLLQIVGLEMAGFASQVWHLYLTQSFLFGVGASCLYGAAMTVPSEWFSRRRGLAMGIVAGGSGIGGLVIPFIMTAINNELGAGWTYRILGFVGFAFNIITCLFVKERKSHCNLKAHAQGSKRQTKKLSEIFDMSVLRNRNFLLFILAANVACMGYFVPLYYLPYNARYLGMSATQASSILSVAMAMNFIGRLASGYLGDRIGPLNAYIVFCILASLSSFLIWSFSANFSALMGYGVVYGFACGAYFALFTGITLTILGARRMATGVSLLIMINAFAYFGANIASAIETRLLNTLPGYQPFLSYKIFTGFVYLLGAFILLFLRWRIKKVTDAM